MGWPDLLSPCCRVTVTPDGTLTIRNISRSDEGRYTCFAENFMGKANSTGILSVRGEGCALAEAGRPTHTGCQPPRHPARVLHLPPSLALRLPQHLVSFGTTPSSPSRICSRVPPTHSRGCQEVRVLLAPPPLLSWGLGQTLSPALLPLSGPVSSPTRPGSCFSWQMQPRSL